MNTTVFIQIVIVSCIGFAAAVKAPASAQATYPFACNMNALSAEERAHLPKVFDSLIAAKPIVKELPDGYELSFPKSTGLFPLAAGWTSAENRCCPFFDLSISVARNGGLMKVKITGPDGVKAFIADDLPRLHRLTTVTKGTK